MKTHTELVRENISEVIDMRYENRSYTSIASFLSEKTGENISEALVNHIMLTEFPDARVKPVKLPVAATAVILDQPKQKSFLDIAFEWLKKLFMRSELGLYECPCGYISTYVNKDGRRKKTVDTWGKCPKCSYKVRTRVAK